ncbi:MAG: hypothetical protein M3132_00215 [Actinomycetia bacterium]|nr:hypothetical protein [Actinomycetes bacterium]
MAFQNHGVTVFVASPPLDLGDRALEGLGYGVIDPEADLQDLTQGVVQIVEDTVLEAALARRGQGQTLDRERTVSVQTLTELHIAGSDIAIVDILSRDLDIPQDDAERAVVIGRRHRSPPVLVTTGQDEASQVQRTWSIEM